MSYSPIGNVIVSSSVVSSVGSDGTSTTITLLLLVTFGVVYGMLALCTNTRADVTSAGTSIGGCIWTSNFTLFSEIPWFTVELRKRGICEVGILS
jgi:hypothetical protein